MAIEWALDNDYDAYIEDLAAGLSLECFVSVGNLQASVMVHADLNVTPVFGTYTIPKIGATPERVGVACYRAQFDGDKITAQGAALVDQKVYLMVREGQNLRVFAELYIRESRASVVNE